MKKFLLNYEKNLDIEKIMYMKNSCKEKIYERKFSYKKVNLKNYFITR